MLFLHSLELLLSPDLTLLAYKHGIIRSLAFLWIVGQGRARHRCHWIGVWLTRLNTHKKELRGNGAISEPTMLSGESLHPW
jgi:hypothetical protein